MSGHKRETVTISQEEYRRMYEAERQAIYETFSTPAQPSENRLVDRELELANLFQASSRRNEEYERLISHLETELREVESHTQSRMKDRETRLIEEMERRALNAEANAQQWINNQAQTIEVEFAKVRRIFEEQVDNHYQAVEANLRSELQNNNRQIREANAHYQAHIDQRNQAIERRVKRQEDRQEQLGLRAVQWLNDCQAMLDYLVTHFPARSLPGDEISEIGFTIQQTWQDVQAGFFESAIATCRTLSNRCSILRLQAEHNEIESAQVLLAVMDAIDDLHSKLQLCRSIPAIDFKGELIDHALDGAEWSPDQFQKLTETIAHLEEQIRQQSGELSLDEMYAVLQNEIPHLHQSILDFVDQVQHTSLNAQIRFNIAQMVVASVISQGYRVTSGSFEAQDFERGYVLHTHAPDGGELVVKIDPIHGHPFASDLHIIARDQEMRTEHELHQRAREINHSLRRFNLQISDTEIVREPSLKRKTEKRSITQSHSTTPSR